MELVLDERCGDRQAAAVHIAHEHQQREKCDEAKLSGREAHGLQLRAYMATDVAARLRPAMEMATIEKKAAGRDTMVGY